MRFVSRLRKGKIHSRSQFDRLEETPLNALRPIEIQQAKSYWLKFIQRTLFSMEFSNLERNSPVARSSPLSSLSPYLDTDGLIRVRGRLDNTDLPEAAKHPIILKSHPLVNTLISDLHDHNHHAGPQLTLALLRQEFWLLRARATVRAVLYKCVKCARQAAVRPEQLMGSLPKYRVTAVSRAFVHTGVDYAGPISVRIASGRGNKSHKAYIALFVCMTIKALHLEFVSDYSTSAFIAAYNRFIARRGLPSAMYSDNGTPFKVPTANSRRRIVPPREIPIF